jgi:hypothetical protein
MFFAHENFVVEQILEALSRLFGRVGVCRCHIDRSLFLGRVDGCWCIIRLGVGQAFYILDDGLSLEIWRNLIPRVDLLSITQSMFVVSYASSYPVRNCATRLYCSTSYPHVQMSILAQSSNAFPYSPPHLSFDESCILLGPRHAYIPPSMSHYGLGAAV